MEELYKSGCSLSLKFLLSGVMPTTESEFSNFMTEYLSEIETEFENTLTCLSGAWMGSNYDKNRWKISKHLLKTCATNI